MPSLRKSLKRVLKNTFRTWKKSLVFLFLIYIAMIPFVSKRVFSTFLYSTSESIWNYIKVEHGNVSNENGVYELNDGNYMEISSTDGKIAIRVYKDVILKFKVCFETASYPRAVVVNHQLSQLFLVRDTEYAIRFSAKIVVYTFQLAKITQVHPTQYEEEKAPVKLLVDYFQPPKDAYDITLQFGYHEFIYYSYQGHLHVADHYYFSGKPGWDFIPLAGGQTHVGLIVVEQNIILFKKSVSSAYTMILDTPKEVRIYIISESGLLSDLKAVGSKEIDIPSEAKYIVIATDEDTYLRNIDFKEKSVSPGSLEELTRKFWEYLDELCRRQYGKSLYQLFLEWGIAIFVVFFFSDIDVFFIALCLALALIFEEKVLEIIDKLAIAWFIVRLPLLKFTLIELAVWIVAIAMEVIPLGLDLTLIPIAWSITIFRNAIVGYLGALPALIIYKVARPKGALKFIIKILGVFLAITVVASMYIYISNAFKYVFEKIFGG